MTYQDIQRALTDLNLGQITDLIVELEAMREQKSREAEQQLIEEMSAKAAELGLSMDRLLTTAKGNSPRAKKSPPLYQNKENMSQTWAGKGRKPAWLQEQLDAGKKLADFKI